MGLGSCPATDHSVSAPSAFDPPRAPLPPSLRRKGSRFLSPISSGAPGPRPSRPDSSSAVASSVSSARRARLGGLVVFCVAVVLVFFSASGAIAQLDSDGDGLSNADETGQYGTDPLRSDTDGDGLPDGVEIAIGTNPLLVDTDGDGPTDAEEYLAGFDPLVSSETPDRVPVTQMPTTTVRPGPTANSDPVPVTVSPEDPADAAPESLAFDDVGSERSAFMPLYVLVAVAIAVGMLSGLASFPEIKRNDPY